MEFHLYGVVTYNPGAGEQKMSVNERFSAETEEVAKQKTEVILSGFRRLPSVRMEIQLDKLIKADTIWRSDSKKQATDRKYF